jgi:hypothetical protein
VLWKLQINPSTSDLACPCQWKKALSGAVKKKSACEGVELTS